jgi:transcription initiation factor TFIIIB Brf1 subunit/transcription initiation factor TFIIB
LIRQTTPSDFTARYCAFLECGSNCKVEKLANYLIERVESYMEGKRPTTLASACIYMAMLKYPQQQSKLCTLENLALVSDLAESTIISTLEEVKQILLNINKTQDETPAKKTKIN